MAVFLRSQLVVELVKVIVEVNLFLNLKNEDSETQTQAPEDWYEPCLGSLHSWNQTLAFHCQLKFSLPSVLRLAIDQWLQMH